MIATRYHPDRCSACCFDRKVDTPLPFRNHITVTENNRTSPGIA